MKIVKLGIWAAPCVVLGSCANLLPIEPTPQGCYSVDTLSAKQQAALDVGRGNPILLAGGQRFVCPCYRGSSLIGTNEGWQLTGAGEEGHLVGDAEEGRLTGAEEKGHLAGAGEQGHLIGTGEQQGHLAGAGEEGHLVGDAEEGRLTGSEEKGHLTGAGERGHLIGTGEQQGHLAGGAEDGHLAGDSAKLSCRIVPECSGYQLIGYAPQQIIVLTAAGQKSVPASCITW